MGLAAARATAIIASTSASACSVGAAATEAGDQKNPDQPFATIAAAEESAATAIVASATIAAEEVAKATSTVSVTTET